MHLLYPWIWPCSLAHALSLRVTVFSERTVQQLDERPNLPQLVVEGFVIGFDDVEVRWDDFEWISGHDVLYKSHSDIDVSRLVAQKSWMLRKLSNSHPSIKFSDIFVRNRTYKTDRSVCGSSDQRDQLSQLLPPPLPSISRKKSCWYLQRKKVTLLMTPPGVVLYSVKHLCGTTTEIGIQSPSLLPNFFFPFARLFFFSVPELFPFYDPSTAPCFVSNLSPHFWSQNFRVLIGAVLLEFGVTILVSRRRRLIGSRVIIRVWTFGSTARFSRRRITVVTAVSVFLLVAAASGTSVEPSPEISSGLALLVCLAANQLPLA